jgi:hypothetical protein
MNTLILLIDFEGFNKLQDQNYLNKRYVALMNILNQRSIDRDKCIVVFNHVNIRTSAEKLKNQWGKIRDPQLKQLCHHAENEKWNVYDLQKETENGFKDIDIETFLQIMKEKRPQFKIDALETRIIIGGTETSGCVLQNKKLGALHWTKRGYDTTIYLPLCSDYSSYGNDWNDKQKSGFANFWNTIKKTEPKDYKTLEIKNNPLALYNKLPYSYEKIKPL